MSDKFLSREDEKQRILGIDLARVETKAGERAVVVTAEAERFTLFWTTSDGAWKWWSRKHDRLAAKTTSPADAARLGWSTHIGIAPSQGRLHLFYKRRFDGDTDNRLSIDVLDFDDAAEAFVPQTPAAPRAVPLLDLGYGGIGLPLWADSDEKGLLVVVQGFPVRRLFSPHIPDGPVVPDPTEPPHLFEPSGPPQLLLLRAAADADPAAAASWTVTVLDDEGGYDFDARREGRRLGVVHRRRAAMFVIDFFLPIDTLSVSLQLADSPGQSGLPPLGTMAAPLVLVAMDLDSGAVTRDDTVPSTEHPQLHALAPVTISGDHLARATINLGSGIIGPQQFLARKLLIRREGDAWRSGILPKVPSLCAPTVLPRNLIDLAAAQTLIAFDSPPIAGRTASLELASLVGLSPIALFDTIPGDKTTGLTFAHARFDFDGIAATRFEVGARDAQTLSIEAAGFSLIDINHAAIRERPEAPENEQFAPFSLQDVFDHDDGFRVRGPALTTNRLGGLITAHPHEPHQFYAYVDMGDGGGRVIYASDAKQPPTAIPPDKKTLSQDMIPASNQTGHDFIRIDSTDFLPLDLPTYRTDPTVDPPAIVSGMQAELDRLGQGLQFLQDIGLLSDGSVEADGAGNPTRLIMHEGTAGDLEDNFLTDESDSFSSGPGQPFRVRMSYSPSPLYANRAVVFSASVPNPPPGPLTFQWDFSDGQSLTGQEVSTTFAPPPGVTPRLPLSLTITLTVTAADGTAARLVRRESVPASLWAVVAAPIDGINFEDTDDDDIPDAPSQFQLRHVELTLSRYHLTFQTTDDFTPLELQVDYLDRHDGEFRFRGAKGQGEIEERTSLKIDGTDVVVNGLLGALIKVNSVTARFQLTRRFTAGTLTSDVRVREKAIETLCGTAGMLPNALACKPVDDPNVELDIDNTKVDAAVPDLTRYVTWVVAALLALVPAALLLALLVPILLLLFPVAVVTMLIAAGLGAIFSALIAWGLAWVITDLIGPPLLSWAATDQFRQSMNSDDTRAQIAKLGVLDDAGEGLAEAIARRVIKQARADGYALANVTDSGRDRARPQLFETIIVTEEIARVKINNARG